MSQTSVLNIVSARMALVFALSGCGGSGGGGGNAETAAAPPQLTTATTVAALVPGPNMNWATAGEKSIVLTLRTADGQTAVGAAVRVFTLSRHSPQDGSSLDEPVPVSLLDTVVSDAAGRASLTLQWQGHVDELLVVATLQDSHGRAVLSAQAAEGVVLRLAR